MKIITHISKQGKQVIVLYISTFLGTIIGVLSSVINTRYLDPAFYGDVKYVQNIISFISGLLIFGFFVSGSRLLALSGSERESRGIRGVMVLLLMASILAVMISMTVSYIIHYRFINEKVASLFLIALPVSGHVLMGNYINTTAQGDNHINRIAISRLLPPTIYVITAYLIYSKFGATPGRMILLQSGISVIIFIVIIYSTNPSFKKIKLSFKKLVSENRKYGIHLYYGSLSMVATSYLSGITLGIFNSNNTDVGFYTLALTITTPLALLPSIVGTSYFKKFATQNRIDKNVFQNTILITVASFILFIILIKPVVSFLYPEEYSVVSLYAAFLAFGTSIHGFGDMINRYLGSHGQGKPIRNSSFFTGIILVSGSFILVYYLGITGAVITKILSSVGYCSILIYYYYKYINQSKKNI